MSMRNEFEKLFLSHLRFGKCLHLRTVATHRRMTKMKYCGDTDLIFTLFSKWEQFKNVYSCAWDHFAFLNGYCPFIDTIFVGPRKFMTILAVITLRNTTFSWHDDKQNGSHKAVSRSSCPRPQCYAIVSQLHWTTLRRSAPSEYFGVFEPHWINLSFPFVALVPGTEGHRPIDMRLSIVFFNVKGVRVRVPVP